MRACDAPAPMDPRRGLLADAVEKMNLIICAAEDPEHVVRFRNRSGGVEGRRRPLLADPRNQRSGEEVSRRGKECGEARVGTQRPRIIALRTCGCQRQAVRAVADYAWQVRVEQVVLAQDDPAACVTRKWMRMVD